MNKQTIHFNNIRMLMSAFFKDILQQDFKIQKSAFIKYIIAI